MWIGERWSRRLRRAKVNEETGVDVEIEGLLGVYSRRGAPVVLIAYSATVVGGCPIAGDEAQDAAYFDSDDLPPLPFPHDDEIVTDWKRSRATV